MKKIILSAAFIAVSVTTFAQVAVGTTSPHASAALDVTSTTQGLLPPRMTQVQMNAIAAPAEGLMVYCSDCIPKGIYVNNGSEFINFITGESSGTDTTTAVVELTSPTTGRIWMNRNLGAKQAATSLTDADAYGDLYQWGRAKDGHQSRTSSTTPTTATSENAGHGDFIKPGTTTGDNWTDFAAEDALWQDGLNDPCPTGYRIPTGTELETEINGFISNATGAFDALKLPLAGDRYSGDFRNVGVRGFLWSSTAVGPNYLRINNVNSIDSVGVAYVRDNSAHRQLALPIRCIKKFVNQSVTDTTTEVVPLTSPTGRIWMDRNLGATQVADSLTDAAAYGDLYQWGRAKDGHQNRTSNTTTTIATSARAGHGNFIIADSNWTDFAADDALWSTGLNDPCPTGYRIPTGPELEAERNGFTSNNATGAFNALKLPLSGFRYSGNFMHTGANGYLWSSTAVGPNYLAFYKTFTIFGDLTWGREFGFAIRCIKEE